MFIDSHCHLDRLDLSPYNGNFDAMLDAAKARQVQQMLCVSIEMEQFRSMYDRIKPYGHIFASVGVHPLNTDGQVVSVEALVEAAQLPRVVAIGETGLDYYYQQDTVEVQQESFRNHLLASSQTGLPTIIHTRDAREDTLQIIRENGNADVGGVLHCFTESLEMAKAALDLNYMISFSGIVTFRNAAELRDVVKAIPMDRILIETDAPYLAPVPHRGKKNEPKYVVEVAQCVADLKGLRIEEVAEQTTANFQRLFSRVRTV
ncbi:TatD family hydrolase [Pontibacterium granulatum]|uniref:TatD family hydrolase n=1 Tax=Pontibacterium granulatum TaxID=2036029 RepID=UPI00249B218D|nr:TatD family hydrolase [Pontibacterium granulatum]MDI3326231.1 TatD family hydrolase [Pontibacterium granulatum]